jgi:hypothetical protein
MRSGFRLLPLAVALMVPVSARSGPNEDGVVIVHAPVDVVYTSGIDYCGQSGLGECSEAVVAVEGDEIATAFLLAAFPPANSPRLAAVAFGIHYSGDDVAIVDWGFCGDFHLESVDWPGPASGAAVTWNEAQTDHLVEICWFAVRSVSGNPATFMPGDHPSRGGGVYFADDAIPANVDIAVDLGRLGFGGDGGYCPAQLQFPRCRPAGET